MLDKLSKRWRQRLGALALRDLLEALRSIDNYTYRHSLRMAELSFWLGNELGYPKPFQLYDSALYHDVGKVAIPEDILAKPGPLSAEERAIVELHVEVTKGLLIESGHPDLAVASDHHERLNGTGYPRGIGDGLVPMEGRIFAVADVFEAVTGIRPYRDALPLEEALNLLRQGVGSLYDPVVVAALGRLLQRWDVSLNSSGQGLLADLTRLSDAAAPTRES